ncbi:MAG TPA: glycosyltransferase [Gaiellaceae bacterium]|nr:glycosyltransferase [Gaiellaceae bacterium]
MRRVAIVHDYLTQRGGAERVVLALTAAFPGARLVTSTYSPEDTYPEFAEADVETLLPAWLPFVASHHRLAFPILGPAFTRHRIRDADVVICSSSGWAHGVASDAPKIVYCHTPARWLYAPDDYLLGHALPIRLAARTAAGPLRRWDMRAAASATRYVANSSVVRDRIREAYGIDAEVVHPPMTLDQGGPQRPVDGLVEPFLLTVARGRAYKNSGVVEDAAVAAGVPLVVVGAPPGTTKPGVVHVGTIDDDQLRWLYAHCRALVAAAYEDFGLTPVEAMAFGKPVLALRAGGYLDSMVDGVTGQFFERADAITVTETLREFDESAFDADAIREHAATFSRERFSASMHEIAADVLDRGG